MPISSIPIYKETLIMGLEAENLPILISGTLIVAELKLTNNPSVLKFAGWFVPFANISGLGDTETNWRRVYLGLPKFIDFSLVYFPATYQLKFKPSYWLAGKSFDLTIWEVT